VYPGNTAGRDSKVSFRLAISECSELVARARARARGTDGDINGHVSADETICNESDEQARRRTRAAVYSGSRRDS